MLWSVNHHFWEIDSRTNNDRAKDLVPFMVIGHMVIWSSRRPCFQHCEKENIYTTHCKGNIDETPARPKGTNKYPCSGFIAGTSVSPLIHMPKEGIVKMLLD